MKVFTSFLLLICIIRRIKSYNESKRRKKDVQKL